MMLPSFKQFQVLQGLLEDKFISFNTKRSPENYSQFPRRVTILSASRLRTMIIPGIKEKTERSLLRELREHQNWKAAKKYSFSINPYLFSFTWRFRKSYDFVSSKVRPLEPLNKNEMRRVKKAYKQYRASLRSSLSPGQVYLFPDSEVTFQNPDRFRHPYARHVLIVDVRTDQLVMVPFTTRLDRINRDIDILFNPDFEGPRLCPNMIPSVENFPYGVFSRPVVLCIRAAQPIRIEEFLDVVLLPTGTLRRDLLDFVRKRMKNFGTLPFKWNKRT